MRRSKDRCLGLESIFSASDEGQTSGTELGFWAYSVKIRSVSHSCGNTGIDILCFSEMSMPRADLFPYFIVLTSPHEGSADPIAIIFEVTLQATKPRTLVYSKEYF